jgi:hypothetical protein
MLSCVLANGERIAKVAERKVKCQTGGDPDPVLITTADF